MTESRQTLPVLAPSAARAVVEAVESPAILLSPDYVILGTNAAYEAHYGARVKVGRDRCYRISHGYDSPCDENGEECPLRAAQATGRNARVFHIHHGPHGPEYVDVSMKPIEEDGAVVAFVETIQPVTVAAAHDLGSFVGRSKAFHGVVEMINRVAPSELPVLLLGESGTGKELAAQALHDASKRKEGPFVPVECSGLSEALIESELFGHKRGAFTGAHEDKAGLIEVAQGGTLFLDEIGDVPLNLQVKLLRVLESGLYRRVGDSEPRRAEFRLVCATHRELPSMVEEGTFRQDLYYRINAFPIDIPPLRARPDDIPLLVERIIRSRGLEARLTPGAEACLRRYPFPGNVRELRNLVERAVVLCDDLELEPRHFPDYVTASREPESASSGWPWGGDIIPLAEVEARYLLDVRERFAGDRRQLAQRLGLSERTLYRKLRGLE